MTIEYKDSKRIVLDTSVTTTNTQATGSTSSRSVYYNTSSHMRRFLGEEFNTGHALVDKTIKEVQFDLLKTGTPNNVYDLVVLSTSNAVTTLESVNLSNVGTSFATYTFNSFTPFILGAGEKIGIYANAQSGTDSTPYVRVAHTSSDVIANANMYEISDEGNTDVTGDLKYTIKYQTSTKPTDVPDNSILIEKDTAKRYWRTPESADITITATGTFTWDGKVTNQDNNRQGFYVANTSSVVYNKTINSVSFWLKAVGSPTGTAYCRVWSSSGSGTTITVAHDFGNIDSSTLTSSYVKYTFNTGSHTLAVGDTVGMEFSNSSDSTNLVGQQGNLTAGFDSGNTYRGRTTGVASPTWSPYSGHNIKFEVLYTTPATWTLGGFQPTDISSLAHWYDASDLDSITKDSSTNRVSQWNDKKGSDNLTESTSGDQPLWTDADQNSKAVIDFVSSRGLSNNASSVAQPNTYFVALTAPSSTGTTRRPFTSGNQQVFTSASANSWGIYAGSQPAFSGDIGTSFQIWEITFNGSSSSWKINNVSKISGQNAGTGTAGSLDMGKPSDNYANNKVGEFIRYDGTLTDAQKTSVYNYLKKKWGL